MYIINYVSLVSGIVLLPNMNVKEYFVFADPDGNLYHLTVDGSVVKDGARLSPPVKSHIHWVFDSFLKKLFPYPTNQNILNGIITLAWKSELVALGDAEGNVAIWEWRTRHFRLLPHSRSPIQKLRFAPGKNNMKLLILHMEGVDIWDVKGIKFTRTILIFYVSKDASILRFW